MSLPQAGGGEGDLRRSADLNSRRGSHACRGRPVHFPVYECDRISPDAMARSHRPQRQIPVLEGRNGPPARRQTPIFHSTKSADTSVRHTDLAQAHASAGSRARSALSSPRKAGRSSGPGQGDADRDGMEPGKQQQQGEQVRCHSSKLCTVTEDSIIYISINNRSSHVFPTTQEAPQKNSTSLATSLSCTATYRRVVSTDACPRNSPTRVKSRVAWYSRVPECFLAA